MARERVAESRSRLEQVGFAFGMHHQQSGNFSTAIWRSEDGKYEHSWRLRMTNMLSRVDYYGWYDADQPWNAPGNFDLAQRPIGGKAAEVRVWGFPIGYRSAQAPYDTPENDTDVVLFVGPGTLFPGDDALTASDIQDGRENTLMAIELIHSGIHWLEPRDLRYPEDVLQPDRNTLLTRLRRERYTPHVLFADFKVFALNLDRITPEELEALITIAGDEKVTRNDLIAKGALRP
jgi:hypothetical protein